MIYERAIVQYKASNLLASLQDFEKVYADENQKHNHPTALYHIAKIQASLGDFLQSTNKTSVLLSMAPEHKEGMALKRNLEKAQLIIDKLEKFTNTTNDDTEWKQSNKWWEEITQIDDFGSKSVSIKESKADLLEKLKDHKSALKELK